MRYGHLRVFLFVALCGELVAAATAAPAGGRVSVAKLAAFYGFPGWREEGKVLTLQSAYTTLSFEADSRKFWYNGLLMYLNSSVTRSGGQWTISECDARDVVDALLRKDLALAPQRARVVVLDPGHGGADTGTIGHGRLAEKKIALAIARQVQAKLGKCDIAVRMTRERDRSVGLADRSRMAQTWGADVFVSIHVNSSPNQSVDGVETFVAPAAGFPATASNHAPKPDGRALSIGRFDAANTLLSYYMQKGVVAYAGARDRGVKRGRFQVVQDAPCPSALVECGFASNPAEARKLLSVEYQDAVADGITRGILTYIHGVNQAKGSSP